MPPTPTSRNCRPYSIRDTYEEGDVVHHPVFDIGFVIEQLPDNKVEVIFRDGGARILVHNRGDLASRMPDIAEIPAPREAKKKKRAKKAETPATPVPQRTKAEVEAAVVRARGAAQARVDEATAAADERNKKLKAEAKKRAARLRPPSCGGCPQGRRAGRQGRTPAKAARRRRRQGRGRGWPARPPPGDQQGRRAGREARGQAGQEGGARQEARAKKPAKPAPKKKKK